MSKFPSVEELVRAWKVEPEAAEKALELVKKPLNGGARVPAFGDFGTSRDKDANARLEEINKLIEGFGIEAIRGAHWNGYWCDVHAVYVNVGDTYALTVLYDPHTEELLLTSYGDWIEAQEREENDYGIY